MQAILPQALAVLFGLLLAYVNSAPVRLMIRYGLKLWEKNEFHNANFILKLVIGVVVCSYHSGFTVIGGIDLLLMGLWMWAAFDIILNLFIHNEWFYIGTTSKIDLWLTTKFKKKAGKIKTLVCFFGIIGLNILRSYL